MNYLNTFIAVAPDTSAKAGTVPPEQGGKKSIALHVRRRGISATDIKANRSQLWQDFFSKPMACMRASPLPKPFGWGLHFDAAGKVALIAAENRLTAFSVSPPGQWLVKRLPIPVLRPFIALVWASNNRNTGMYEQVAREHVLPNGMMHIVFRLTDYPLRILDSPNDLRTQPVGSSMVCGVRSQFYIREMVVPSCSVGAVLRPGAAALLFGAPADELAERHMSLEDLWGASAGRVHERLLEAESAEVRLAALENTLTERLPRVRSLHPAIASVINEVRTLSSIEAAVQRSGLSHRHFIAHFRQVRRTTCRWIHGRVAMREVNFFQYRGDWT